LEGGPLKVTFDSNVWEALVSEAVYPIIKEKILSREISPSICEIALALESIQKSVRQQFFPSYNPVSTWTQDVPRPDGRIGLTIQMGPNTEMHPGLSPILLKKLHMAQDLGFKILPMTNFLQSEVQKYQRKCGLLSRTLTLIGHTQIV
jgi:hypothetical protein